ncbi:MAG: adenylate/guanylate cyclase domain-containing protein [Candidatus Binatia bacterium]
MLCPQCQHENTAVAKFCEECGTRLVRVCPGCGQEVTPRAKFCSACGATLKGKEQEKRETGETEGEGEKGKGEKGETGVPSLQPTAERRQLTVVFCDLVGSTALSVQLDPEDYRVVVQGYQAAATAVIARHHGYLAQHWGDGLLVYFGYPTAHEDEARRAVRAGLEIVETLQNQMPSPLVGEGQGEGGKKKPLQVRIGIHTGLVVIGEIGSSEKRELLALGETPNIAARLQGLAEPNTVLVSAATQRLIDGYFESEPFGAHLLKGIETPIAVYHVQSERQSVSPLTGRTTLTPLIGREQEVGLLIDRWEQAKEGRGQVVLLSGEPGIGKSRLAYTLREQVTREGSLVYEAHCSPYHQQSALYPLIEAFQRTLPFTRQDSDEQKVAKLAQLLGLYAMQESLPLFTALLSLPTPAQYPPLNVTPQKQKERTFQALLQLMAVQAERQATVSVWEDLHWADPSSLEFLSLLIDQIPTTKLLLVLTFRPEFVPSWKPRSHISQVVLNRLGKKHVEAMIAQVAENTGLSAEVMEQIRVKTDGVPLFVEELTKSVVEARGQVSGHGGQDGKNAGALAIPATLQEALLARLDRLSEARQIAQLGATLGREFSHELLQAVAPLNEEDLHTALAKLVEAEILYQRGMGEQARYVFKHALIQDTAYQSLLKSTRQQYHQQIAQVLEERFPDIKANQPELLAHHYTEANLIEQAIPYWQQAGERAIERSANEEAVRHLTTGIELLRLLPLTPKKQQGELVLQTMLGVPLMATKGWSAPEVGRVFSRAHELSQQIEETPQLFPILIGLAAFYMQQSEYQTGKELLQRCLRVARSSQDPTLTLVVDYFLSGLFAHQGDFIKSQEYYEHGLALYDVTQHGSLGFRFGIDPGAGCRYYAITSSWYCGYPDQALKKAQEAWTFAQNLLHPTSQAWTVLLIPWVYLYRREATAAQEWAETAIAVATEKEQIQPLSFATIFKGYALAEQGRREEGLSLLQKGLADWHATGAKVFDSLFLVWQAQVCRGLGRIEDGLAVLAEAQAFIEKTGERMGEAELYRLKGELTLQSSVQSLESRVKKAEECFLEAIAIAQQQQAKSWELRAATSLARLWQSQGKTTEARELLAPVYNWFTEGFGTKDLQEAKVLLEELSNREIESSCH